jgi:hypothetical protein
MEAGPWAMQPNAWLVEFREICLQKWPPGRCDRPDGCLPYTRSGKKPVSVPLPGKPKRFGPCANNGFAVSDL